MRGLVAIFIAACLVAVACADVLGQVQNGYYYGRSGDIVVHRKAQQTESFASFVDPHQYLSNAKNLHSMSELELAASISNLLSLPHANGDAVAPVSADMFRKPRTAIIVHADGLTSAIPQRALAGLHDKIRVRVVPDALPESVVAGAATLSTGVPPAVHGVVGNTWIDTVGHTVSAFSHQHDSHSAVPTLADRMHQSYGSCGATVVFGATPAIARAFAARATVDDSRSFAFALDNGRFVEVTGRVPHAILAAQPGSGLAAQLAGMHAAVEAAAAISAESECPTAVVVALDAFETLLSEHADDSALVTAAGQKLAAAVSSAVQSLPGAVAVVVGAGRAPSFPADIAARVLNMLPPGAQASAESFPHIFAPSNVRAACAAARTALRGTEFEVFCPRADAVLHRKYAVLSAGNPGVLVNASNTTYIDNVWQFNLFFWLTLFVVVVLIAIVWGFSTAENKRDSLIYRSPRPESGPRGKTD